MPRPLCDSPFLYGFHDAGAEQVMLDVGAPGWVLMTEAIGHDPNDRSGRDYRPFSDRDLGVIVRLNNAYSPGGTIPHEVSYADFARRCANFVAASQGAHIWIIGNETNHPIEWPGAEWSWGPGWPSPVSPDKRGEEITPARYASCYKQCRTAIKNVAGHAQDQVLVSAPAPWNILLTYPSNPTGDWVKYFVDMVAAIGAGNLDGLTLHTYTHGASPSLITSDERMGDERFKHLRYHFRAYQDFMAMIPQPLRGLPVYITESNQGDQPWENTNAGWVRAAYAEIDAWNRSNRQQIRSFLLYRWPQVDGDRWGVDGKAGVIEDFRQALGPRYQWKTSTDPQPGKPQQVAELEQAIAVLKPTLASWSQLAGDAVALKIEAEGLSAQLQAANPTGLRSQIDGLGAQIQQLEAMLGVQPPNAGPEIVDKIGQLPSGNTPYPHRDPAQIRRIVIHHTVTPGNVTPEAVARAVVNRGLPGIHYHFMITSDGTIFATQSLDVVTSQTGIAAINSEAVGIALAGDFTSSVPSSDQMTSASRLIAHLLQRFGLAGEAVVGRREVEGTASPGNQWLSGAQYKAALMEQVNRLLSTAKVPDESSSLRLRIAQLETQLAASETQISSLAAQTAELQKLGAGQAAEIDRLRTLLANSTTGRVVRPPVVDLVDKLPKHPTLPPYGPRTRPISMIVIHHTDTPKTTTAQQIAQYHVHGERKDASGKIVKAQWPGVGYHFLISPDGVIHQGQLESTRSYHVGGDPNDYSVAISLIGRFMRKNYDNTDRSPEDQVPTPQQLRSAGQLAAWLMQEHKISIDQIKGHRDVWPKATVCPGEHWHAGLNWHPRLLDEIRLAQGGTGDGGGVEAHPIDLYLLLWDHGGAWAEADWRSSQGYIARFRPMAGFSVNDALLAQHVVIVGGPAGVSGQDEARLRSAGVEVHRLAGVDEADTKRMLDELAQMGSPWPGAPAALPEAAPQFELEVVAEMDEVVFPDEWTLPDDWVAPDGSEAFELAVLAQLPPKVFVPLPLPEMGDRHE